MGELDDELDRLEHLQSKRDFNDLTRGEEAELRRLEARREQRWQEHMAYLEHVNKRDAEPKRSCLLTIVGFILIASVAIASWI